MRSHFYDMDYIERKDLIIKMSKLMAIITISNINEILSLTGLSSTILFNELNKFI